MAYERAGGGPPLVLVGGGLTDRAENAPLARELARAFTTYNYDRRGRGASGDAAPYALERELEDLAAVIAAAGGRAHVFGVSSGGALALEAAAAGLPIARLALYEVPYLVAEADLARWRDYAEALPATLAAGDRGGALERFMRLAGSDDAAIAHARAAPVWGELEALAPTLAYDAACLGDGRVPAARLRRVGVPVLVLCGGRAPELFVRAADALVAALPGARRATLDGQGHVADPAVAAPVLTRFFAG